ncbi:MAG: hypothetical protein DLM57_05330 [Pseudonocardiales bacterium]|nr:MAG: hypothetical protein DLM57_05330 [Pseudonocardiales bacterium]
MWRTLLVGACCLLVADGCSSVDSTKIRTGGLRAAIAVTVAEGGSGAQVEVTLNVGTLTYVKLGKADSLVATSATSSVRLRKSTVLGNIAYLGKLDGVRAAGTVVTIAFKRGPDDTSAPNSTVALAAPVHMSNPSAGATFSRSHDTVTVSIDGGAAPGAITVGWAGPCVLGGSIDVAPGYSSVSIAAHSIVARPASSPTGPTRADSCPLTLTTTRQTEGHLDPAYGSGAIYGRATSTRQIISTP